MNTSTLKVNVDGKVRRFNHRPFFEDAFKLEDLLSLVSVDAKEFRAIYYYDDEDEKIYVANDDDLNESKRAQAVREQSGSWYFKIFVETKSKPASCPPRRRGPAPCFMKPKWSGFHTNDSASGGVENLWYSIISMITTFSPFLPKEIAEIVSSKDFPTKLNKIKESSEMKKLLGLLEQDNGCCSDPFSLLKRVKGTAEFKMILKRLKQDFPELGNFLSGMQDTTVHFGVTCDGCTAYPIRGLRFKCRDCPDFDFCADCRFSKDHDTKHSFETVEGFDPMNSFIPSSKRPFGGLAHPLFARNCFSHDKNTNEKPNTNNPWGRTGSLNSSAQSGTSEKKASEEQAKENNEKQTSSRSTDDEYEVVTDGTGLDNKEGAKVYESELKVLEEMGFKNEHENIKLLQQMSGNLRNVVQALFSSTK